MQQLNSYVFYVLGKWLDSAFISAARHDKIKSNFAAYQSAVANLDTLIDNRQGFRLDESAGAAVILRDVLREILAAFTADPESIVPDLLMERFYRGILSFDQAFALELGRAPIFYVTRKGIYDTRGLIIAASNVYQGYIDRLPAETIDDTDQAGRCLAFELWTAAGFHIARAGEATMKRYMEVYQCMPAAESKRNWGEYVRLLTEKKANPKVLNHITQAKNLHRNPLIHPEARLQAVEAMGLWGLMVSLIQAMVADMETKAAKPDPAIVSMIPPDEPPA